MDYQTFLVSRVKLPGNKERYLSRNQEIKRKTKNNISTSDKDTIKGQTLSNIRGRNDGSKRQRKVASNRPGPKLFSG